MPSLSVNTLRKYGSRMLLPLVLLSSIGAPAPALAVASPVVSTNPASRAFSEDDTVLITTATITFNVPTAERNTLYPIASVAWTITCDNPEVAGAANPCTEAGASIVPSTFDPRTSPFPATADTQETTGPFANAFSDSIIIAVKQPVRVTVNAAPDFAGTAPVVTFSGEFLATDLNASTAPSIAGMRPDPLVTSLGHFTIRARDLLGYALKMQQELTDDADTNPIYAMYARSRGVANVLFIIALMLIAFLYNFAILISRDRLRRLIILFVIAIIGVNFSYTVASVAIQGSDRLFRILLVRDEAGNPVDTTGGTTKVTVQGNKLEEVDLLTMKNFTYSGFVGASKVDMVDGSRPSQEDPHPNNRFRENIYFNLGLMMAGSIAQFLIVLVLLARIVILWALIIVAPFFFLLAIFKFSQEIFKYWGWFFTRWLLLGPLMALFLSANIRIWTSVNGVPISSTYERATLNTFFPNIMNIWVAAPGIREGINLETPEQVIKYMMALMMMYLSLLLPFWLTRRILIFSPDKQSLLSRLLGGDRSKVKTPVSTEPKPEQPKPPLKGGFTFNEAKAKASVAAKATAATGATVATAAASGVAAASARTASALGAATTLGAASLSAAASARTQAGASVSAEGDSIVRAAVKRMGASSQTLGSLATNAVKPKALPRSLDAKVQTAARSATKREMQASELAALTTEELTELRTHLSSLASSNVLGTNSAVTTNLRAIERESKSRVEQRTNALQVQVKVESTADRAEKKAIDQQELGALKLAELQALKATIESRVQANPALAKNESLRTSYERLTAQIAAQTMSAIATITPAITAQTSAIVQAIGQTTAVTAGALKQLTIPELKEASLAIHRMERAIRTQTTNGLIQNNLATLHEREHDAQNAANAQRMDMGKIEAILASAVERQVTPADIADLSMAEMHAAAQELEAINALANALGRNVKMDTSAPAFKESVVNVHAELKARDNEPDDGKSVSTEKLRLMLRRLATGNAIAKEELVQLSVSSLRTLNRELLAVAGGPGGLPSGPLDGDLLVAALGAIDHELQQRQKLGSKQTADSHVPLLAALKKVRANSDLATADLSPLSDSDLQWLRDHVDGLLQSIRGEHALESAVDGIQAELKARRLEELATQCQTQSPKVAELFRAITTGAEVKDGALSTLRIEDLRTLAEAVEKSAALVQQKIARSANFTASLRATERTYQRKSLALLVQKVLEASPAATSVLAKMKSAETISTGELENLSLPELEAVQAESYRLNLIAPAQLKQQATYRDNLATISQMYEARVIEGKATSGGDSDQRFRFITGLQEAIGATLAGKIDQLKSANKDDLAAELSAEREDLSGLVDRSAELAAERAEWIEYFRVTPVPKLEGITSRGAWIEAEQRLAKAIYDEIASQDWVIQAKGIADAAANLLMGDTSSMTPIQILTALAVKAAAADEALALVKQSDESELVFVPAKQEVAAAAAARLRTYDEDEADEAARAKRAAEIGTPPTA